MAKPRLVKVRALFVFLQNVSYEKRMPRFETPSLLYSVDRSVSLSHKQRYYICNVQYYKYSPLGAVQFVATERKGCDGYQ